jgi:putative endonuclease
MYYIYIIYSNSSDIYYVGHSDDPFRRLNEHNHSTFTTFTSKHRPWEAAAFFAVGYSKGEAMRIEKFIKRQKSRKLLERLVDAYAPLPGELSMLVRVLHIKEQP